MNVRDQSGLMDLLWQVKDVDNDSNVTVLFDENNGGNISSIWKRPNIV